MLVSQIMCYKGKSQKFEIGDFLPTIEEWREAVLYDAESGQFTWIKQQGAKSGSRADRPVGRPGNDYLKIRFSGRRYSAHRVAWLLTHGEWPAGSVDHIDGDRFNNRISNLRLATHQQNMCNRGATRTNKLGLKGVTKTPNGRYRATITVPDKNIYIGTFDTADEAHAAYYVFASNYHGEFARAR